MKTFASLLLAGTVLATGAVAQDAAPEIKMDQALHDRLPEAVKTAGKMISVNNGSFPPYEIVEGDHMTGASADLTDALEKLLGVEIEHETVGGLPALLTGVNSGRYQFAFGPIGDFKSREEANDFVDWVQEFVVFAVKTGNPKGIVSLDTACGTRISVMAGGSAERVIKAQSDKCVADGKDAVTVQSYTDQPSSVLAVRSNRADAFFSSQAPLTYFVAQANGQLELTGVGEKNGFDNLYQGAVVPKGSELGPVLLDAVKELQANGTYAVIMKKWGLENNMLAEPGINLGGVIPK
ncbi:ABC transporter substrate-binding protein [Frigidibacter sp. MR17.14]|uniref:ABC transporter substrate-binding protein n=1 Tax=Frigidibacter sp. MR17.14 TaxID=3126509 RepID=UPI003012D606